MVRNHYPVHAQRKNKAAVPIFITLAFCFFCLIVTGIWLYTFSAQTQKIVFEPLEGPLINPLMGLAPWATVKTSFQPHTLVYADLSWREFEPEQGVFDFETFEKQNQFERWRSEGKRVVFRFVCDFPKREDHLDIPDWLYLTINGDGDHYNGDYGKGFSPNYANPIFIEFHQKAVQALGARYAGDDFIAYIELGSLGHWGEWHTDETAGVRQLPSTSIRDKYVIHYREAFPNTHLLMRRPFAIAQQLNLGLFNDMMGDYKSTTKWLDWIQKGGEYGETGEPQALKPMENGWKLAPFGGEQTSNIKNEDFYGTLLDRSIKLIRESHSTFMGPGGPYDVPNDSELQPGIDKVLTNMGYRLYIKEIEMPKRVLLNDTLEMKIIFGNAGVAPIYYNWPVVFYLHDQNNKLRVTQPYNMDIRYILPDQLNTYPVSIPTDNLENGTYQIAVAILDPLTDLPGIQLAMRSGRKDRIQELGSFEISHLAPW